MATEESKKSSPFSAADPALGYLYQCRVALAESLRRRRRDQEFVVSLETLDDVTFESSGAASELLQLKHHKQGAANLTNASPDLWKSLRVWFEGRASGAVPKDANLYLVTTASAGANSAAERLKLDESVRDVAKALSALRTTAQTSESKENAAGYAAFLSAKPDEQEQTLKQVFVLDGSPTVLEVDRFLREEVYYSAEKEHHEAFLERLEGWWFRRVMQQLATPSQAIPIHADEIESEMDDLREQFKRDSLPIDDDVLLMELDEATKAAHGSSIFVRQLELVTSSSKRISQAIHDYLRAFEQRSRWNRSVLLFVGEMEKYESRLCEAWSICFEQVLDELGPDAAEDAKRNASLQVLKWAENVSLPIRPGVTESFVTRGSLHILADGRRVGWHIEFRDRLTQLLADGAIQ